MAKRTHDDYMRRRMHISGSALELRCYEYEDMSFHHMGMGHAASKAIRFYGLQGRSLRTYYLGTRYIFFFFSHRAEGVPDR